MRVRRLFLLTSLAYLAFVVYGSLVPLEFVRIPWDEAWLRFSRVPYYELGIESRADWVANLLLFVPLAYLWCGVLWRRGQPLWNTLGALLVAAAGACLSIGIEFVQLFFPQRTVSINDIVAEIAGTIVGVLLWRSTGEALQRWLEEWFATRDPASRTRRVLHVYLAGLYAYSVMPLDLTISPVELYHKWNTGKIAFMPFGWHYASTAEAVYGLAADVVIWIPVAMLWRLSGHLSAMQVWLRVGLAATLIEFCQLFVYSRVTNSTDVLMALLGAAIGAAIAGRLTTRPLETGPRSRQSARWGLWLAAFVLWLVVIVLVFWYPFELRIERNFVAERLRALWRVPFTTYYFGSEFRALTEVLHKVLFFMPGGALLACLPARVPAGGLRTAVWLFAGLLASGLALTVELVQVLMPDKVADATDWFLATLGALLGALLAWPWLKGAQREPAVAAESRVGRRTAS